MADVADLRLRHHAEIAYLWVVEGWPCAWVTRPDLAGSGALSWIGTAYGARTLLVGLEPPASVKSEIDLEDGLLNTSLVKIQITDHGGELAGLLGTFEVEYDTLGERLRPSDDPAPAQVFGFANGPDLIDLHGRHINNEAIGSAGQRRHFSCLPLVDLPGPDHAALDGTDLGGLAPVLVSDQPKTITGRRWALFRLYRDVDSPLSGFSSWPSWSDQFADGGLVTWGTLREEGIRVRNRVWELTCYGPDSWLRKSLNVAHLAKWYRVQAYLELSKTPGKREDLLAIALSVRSRSQPEESRYHGASVFDESLALDAQYINPDTLTSDVDQAITSIKSVMGPAPTTWDNDGLHPKFSLYPDNAVIRIDDDASDAMSSADVWLIAHYKVLRFMGYDPIAQCKPVENLETDRDLIKAGVYQSGQPITLHDESGVVPGPGYYGVRFSTIPTGNQPFPNDSNHGADRKYRPATDGGVVTLNQSGGQEVALAIGTTKVYLEGQSGRPPSNATINDVQVDSTRWFAFRGPITREDGETDEYSAVAKVSWVDDDGSVGLDATQSRRVVHLDRWEDPREYGFDNKPLDVDWSGTLQGTTDGIECTPLAVLQYQAKGGWERANEILVRLLLSTGTGGYEPGTYEEQPGPLQVVLGTNASGSWIPGNDLEISDLGLQIPAILVDRDSFQQVAEELPGGADSDLNRCKVAFHGAMNSLELLGDLMAPRGWVMTLRGRKYGLWTPYAPLSPDDVDFTIGDEDIVTTGADPSGWVTEVEMKAVSSFDRITVEYGHTPTDGSSTFKAEAPARDPGAGARLGRRLRRQGGDRPGAPELRQPSGRYLPTLEIFRSPPTPPQWRDGWEYRWTREAAEWCAKPHMLLKGVRIGRIKGQDIYPGARVLVTDDWPVSSAGTYGIQEKIGVVVSTDHKRDGSVLCNILVQPESFNSLRMWAPIAWLVDDVATAEERYDPGSRIFYCQGNWSENTIVGSWSDVAAFVEPYWSSLGGDALVYGWQYNGVAWAQTFSFEVESVDTSLHTITHKTGTFSGIFYNRMYTALIFAPYDDQTAAWVKARHVVITKSSGKFGGADTQGWKLP